jgi:hypothetical protein
VNAHAAWIRHIPLFQEIAIFIKNLDPVILVVTDKDSTILVDPDIVYDGKFSRASTLTSPT